MNFKKLKIEYQGVEKRFEFSSSVNLVNSTENSVGKSTLLRLLFFSMGYSVPGTKGILFKKVNCELVIETANGLFLLKRINNQLELTVNNNKCTFLLPSDVEELHSTIFGTSNISVVSNILGAIYLDQEKGWTLLNRGTVIGKIPFDITKLVAGLAERKYDELELEFSSSLKELKKYKTMRDIYDYQTSLIDLKEDLSSTDYIDELERDLNILKIEKNNLSNQIDDIKLSKRDNLAFVNYIENMRIFVTDGEKEIPVMKSNIVDFDKNQDFLNTRISILDLRKRKIEKQINEIEKRIGKENGLISIQSQIQKFDAQIAGININQMSLEKIIKQLEIETKRLKKDIKTKVSNNNGVINSIYFSINKYAKELGVSQYIDDNKDYIFTDELSGLSGAVLHKIVFVFKVSYIIEIEKYLNCKLPIVLDSPSGREVDQKNISDIMNILSRDFKDNQIIIASIFDNYGFESLNRIVIENGLFYQK